MLFIPSELRPSPIHGTGVFTTAPVAKGQLVWRFDSRIDRVYSESEVQVMPAPLRLFMETYATLHRASGLMMLYGDNARHINHADHPNLVSAGIAFGDLVAARDLHAGEELTDDYRTICDDPFPFALW